MADSEAANPETEQTTQNMEQAQPPTQAETEETPVEQESNEESSPLEQQASADESKVEGEPQNESEISQEVAGAADGKPTDDGLTEEGATTDGASAQTGEGAADDSGQTAAQDVASDEISAGDASPEDSTDNKPEADATDVAKDLNKEEQASGDGETAEEGQEAPQEEQKEQTEQAEVTEGEEPETTEAAAETSNEDGQEQKETGDANQEEDTTEKAKDTEKAEDTEKSNEDARKVPEETTTTAITDEPKEAEEDKEDAKPLSPTMEVSENLSRGATPTADAEPPGDGRTESPPNPASPPPHDDGVILEQEEDLDEEEEPLFDREQLIEQYHEAIAFREQLRQKNSQVQHKLAEYFRKKQSDDNRAEGDINVTDQEQRYLKYMANLEELRHHDAIQRKNYKEQIEEHSEKTEEKKKAVNEEEDKFMEFKKQVAMNSINSRSGKPIPQKDIDGYLAADVKKDGLVFNVRLENIKLKNKLRKKETQLKLKEELAEGLHLIDFEQLKIENQTYNEKIEERNEELLKLKKKITTTVEVLTHVKEKLQFVQAENQVTKAKLREVEEEVAKKRDKLTRTKQARDQLRIDNHRLRQSCGLLGNEPLLRDFEDRKNESDELRQKLEDLKMLHAELTVTCNGVRKKIDQVKPGQ